MQSAGTRRALITVNNISYLRFSHTHKHRTGTMHRHYTQVDFKCCKVDMPGQGYAELEEGHYTLTFPLMLRGSFSLAEYTISSVTLSTSPLSQHT